MELLSGLPIENLALMFLAMVAAGGVAYVFLYPLLSGEVVAQKRQKQIEGTRSSRADKVHEISKRDQVLSALKDMESKQKKAKAPPIHVQIEQAGLKWTMNQFWMFSIVAAIVMALGTFIMSSNLYVALGGLFVGGIGLPRWYLGYKKKKRLKAFSEEFPNALDVIVRGVKAGLPLGDCVRIIANEAADPVKGEFRTVTEAVTMGIPLGDAVMRIYERMPCAEANFFGIVISIQQKAGGNLSEALGNLSKVLRERKKMRAKIAAVSTEAKASAMIIGSLPIVVMLLVYFTTPKYIALLWETNTGNIMMVCSAIWMLLGILTMKKMIAFDF